MVVSGMDKLSIIIGPLFLVASLFSVLRQTGRMSIDTEVPILVIVVGVLKVISRLSVIRAPAWIIPDKE
jgi:hypothetical protein